MGVKLKLKGGQFGAFRFSFGVETRPEGSGLDDAKHYFLLNAFVRIIPEFDVAESGSLSICEGGEEDVALTLREREE